MMRFRSKLRQYGRLLMRRNARHPSGGGGGFLSMGEGAPTYRMGANVSGQSYYGNFGQRADLGREGLYLGGGWSSTENANGWLELPNGATGSYTFAQELRFADCAALDGNYVVWIDAPAGVTMTIQANSIISNITAAGTNRYTCTINTAAVRAGETDAVSRLSAAISSASIRINVVNSSGAVVAPVPHMARTADEADVLAGKRWSQRFIDAQISASGGPIRPMWAMGSWMGWWGDAATPVPRDFGQAKKDYTAVIDNYGGAGEIPVVVRSATKEGGYWSPEDCAELWERTGQPVWLCFPPMCTDARLDEFFTRFLAYFGANPLPNTPVYLEFGNECWNFGSGLSSIWTGRGYNTVFRPGVADATRANRKNQFENHAHGMYRLLQRGKAHLGAKAFIIHNMQHVYPGNPFAQWSLDFVATGSTKLAQVPELRNTTAPYYLSGVSQERPLANLRTAIRDRWYIDGNVPGGGTAAAYWQTRLAANITSLATNVDDWNTYLSGRYGAGVTKIHGFYEGMTSHDVLSPSNPALVGATSTYQALVYQAGSNRWMPSAVTLDGVAEDHSAESAASFWLDGEKAFATRSSNATLLRDGFFVKLQNGGLNLFASKADYDSNTVSTWPDGTTMHLTNVTRTAGLWELMQRQVSDDPAQALNEAMRTAMRSRGVTDIAVYLPVGQYNPWIDNWVDYYSQDMRCFHWKAHLADTTAAHTWYQTKTA